MQSLKLNNACSRVLKQMLYLEQNVSKSSHFYHPEVKRDISMIVEAWWVF